MLQKETKMIRIKVWLVNTVERLMRAERDLLVFCVQHVIYTFNSVFGPVSRMFYYSLFCQRLVKMVLDKIAASMISSSSILLEIFHVGWRTHWFLLESTWWWLSPAPRSPALQLTALKVSSSRRDSGLQNPVSFKLNSSCCWPQSF